MFRQYESIHLASQEWLRRYRMGCAGVDGGVGVFALSREQLQRWYFVEEMSPTQLQQKYRVECGVYADRAALVKWLRVLLQNPECVVFLFISGSSPCLA